MVHVFSTTATEGLLLDCETWLNEDRISFLDSNSQSKEVSPVFSDIQDSLEKDVSYQFP